MTNLGKQEVDFGHEHIGQWLRREYPGYMDHSQDHFKIQRTVMWVV